MALARYVTITYTITGSRIPGATAYNFLADAIAAGVAANAAGGFKVVDSWELGTDVYQATIAPSGVRSAMVNQNQTVSWIGTTSNIYTGN